MEKGLPDENESDISLEVRRELAVIQAQSELLLETASTSRERDGLARIHRSTLELGSLVSSGPTHGDIVDPFSGDVTHDTVDRILICSQSEYLNLAFDAIPTSYGDIDIVRTTRKQEAASILSDTDVDRILIDAVWPDTTGVNLIAELTTRVSVPPYALLSVSTLARSPVALILSAVCSPNVSAAQLDQLLGTYLEVDTMTVAGLFSDDPGGAVSERVADHPDTMVSEAEDVATRVTPNEMSADAVCLDTAVYRTLSPTTLAALRTIAPGRGRPLILMASTDGDPHDRAWIPTLGSQKFLHRPPTVTGLLEALFVDGKA